ncbi:MAG: TRAM domain-containing protein, partial [Chloroflexota bacterium]
MTDHENPIIEVELETMANGGSALARHDGRVVFIPYTIPGEVVEAQIVQDRGRVAFAKGVRMLEPSADRVFPACQHFGAGKCAGCQWQHMNATAQLLIKQDVLADQ